MVACPSGVQVTREAEEKRAAKAAEHRRLALMKAQREKELREAAFDGDLAEVKKLLSYDDVAADCKDANHETPLLEAACGGSVPVIGYLAKHGADMNARGKFDRTPLYRAAFSGHHDAVLSLLKFGGDPRLFDASGFSAADVSATAECTKIFDSWDLTETDRLMGVLERKREAEFNRKMAIRQAESESLAEQLAIAEKRNHARQKELAKAYQEYAARTLTPSLTRAALGRAALGGPELL